MNKSFMMGFLGMLFGILIGFLGAGLLLLLTRPPKGNSITLKPALPPLIKVSVKGAVASPGVYSFEHYSRVEDAIEAAGGFREDADSEAINLAGFLEDGMQLYIPAKKLTITDSSSEKSKLKDGKSIPTSLPRTASEQTPTIIKVINVNQANVDELMTLPRIGKATAQKIIEYRETYGLFKTIDDLKQVSGIGQSVFDAIKPYIAIQP